MNLYKSGAWKMMIFNHFDGYLGTHICQYCNSVYPVSADIIRIAHFKNRQKIGNVSLNNYLHSTYTSTLKEMVINTH